MSGWRPAWLSLLALLTAGCGGSTPEDHKGQPPGPPVEPRDDEKQADALRKALRALVQTEQDFAEILSRVKDRQSMQRALARIEARHDDFERAAASIRAFVGSPAPMLQRVQKEFEAELTAAKTLKAREGARILELPVGKEFFEALAKIGKGRSER